MKTLQLITIDGPTRGVAEKLEPLGFAIVVAHEPEAQGTVLLEAERGGRIAEAVQNWQLDPIRVVAICAQPDGLPQGCLWLCPQQLDTVRTHNLLRAWLTESKEDPVHGLLAQISHDMRSPLSVISTAASLIAKFGDNTGKTARYLALINESSGALKSLVNDILDYSNIREGEFAFSTSDFHLHQLLYSVTDSFRLLVKDPETLKVECEIAPNVPESVHGDPGRLRQILTNLLNNALKFTQQGRVALYARVQESLLRFEVQDTGVGIRPEALERIFLPYQQADKTIHSKFGGTGLGLTICRALTQRMGGTIGVTSEFGRGSSFWFTAHLPAVEVDKPTSLPELRGRNIFVGSRNAHLFTASLAAQNQLTVYATREEVKQNVGAGDFALYVIDLDLGEWDLVRILAREHKDSTIVVLTSVGQRGDVALCKEIGVSGYLTTPIEPLELEIALALALESDSNDIVTKYTAKELLAAQK